MCVGAHLSCVHYVLICSTNVQTNNYLNPVFLHKDFYFTYLLTYLLFFILPAHYVHFYTLTSPHTSSLPKAHFMSAQQCFSVIRLCFASSSCEGGIQLRLFPATTCSPSRNRQRWRETGIHYKLGMQHTERERERENQKSEEWKKSWKVLKE